LDAVLYVIVRVRVSVMVMVRVWGFYMGDGAVSLVSSVGGGGGFLASIATYGNTEHESVNHGQFKRKGTQETTKERTAKQGEKGKRERWKDGGGVGAVFFHVFNFFSAKHFIQKPLFHFFASFLQNYP
jgi:hypothetical protein